MRHQCQHCETSFSILGNLNSHLKKKHGITKNNTCECGKKFEGYQSLNAHYRSCVVHRNGKSPAPSPFKGKTSPYKGISTVERYGAERAAEINAKVSASNTGRTFTLSEETKRKQSLKRIQTLETSPHVQWFEVAGIKVQGSWEKLIGEKLVEDGYEIRRERLAYDGHRHYTPDFYIPSLDLYVEVKGWLSDRDKTKYRKVMIEHSDKTIKILMGRKTVLNFKSQDLFNLPDLKDTI